MSDTRATESSSEPLSASADGKRNAQIVTCHLIDQRMSYAACLNRIDVLKRDIDVPKDWNVCDRVTCAARQMREEEEAKGCAIYFVQRGMVATAAATVKRWFSPWANPAPAVVAKKPAAAAAPAPKKGKGSVLDHIGDVGSYADVISMGDTPAIHGNPEFTVEKVAAQVEAALRKPLPVAKAGETPLQMARRLAAARKTEVQA